MVGTHDYQLFTGKRTRSWVRAWSCLAAKPVDEDIDKTPRTSLPIRVGLAIRQANLRSQKVDGRHIIANNSVGSSTLYKQGRGLRKQAY
jgi:hypothetical protein